MSVNKVNSDGSLLRVAGGTLYADAPIGSEMGYDSNSVPSGYLRCDGSTFSATAYPELYSFLGSNILPKSSDHSSGLDWDNAVNLTIGSDNTITEDGYAYIHAKGSGNSGCYLIVNGKIINASGNGTGWDCSSATNVSKGDVVKPYIINTSSQECKFIPYKRYNIIKAKQVAVPFDVAEYIRNQNVLSDYESITLPTTAATAMTMPYDGIYILANYGVSYNHHIWLNGKEISSGITGNETTGASVSSTIRFKKGDTMYRTSTYTSSLFLEHVAYYKLRDYTGR